MAKIDEMLANAERTRNKLRDEVLEEAAQICEGVTHWGLSSTKLEVAKSTQRFCAKAIRAQIGSNDGA